MKYRINKTNYCSFNVFQDNKLAGRSYFIPYLNKESIDKVSLKEKRYKSEKVICLNGDWDFIFYPRPKDVPDVFDTDSIKFDKIDVPSCWQFRGYDRPFYVNVRYQFHLKPPHIPEEEEVGKVFSWIGVDQKVSLRFKKPKDEYNFVGIYRRFFKIKDLNKNYIISFLGVASCLDLYINGQYVGYSEGSHNTAEFDLTKLLVEGENELVAVVHRWCNGTYLEGQDMFRNNGIFRDVLLRVSDNSDIYDIDVKTTKVDGFYELALSATLFNDGEVTFHLEGHGIKLSQKIKTIDKVAKATFSKLDVKEWSAESPTLYSVYFETDSCCVKESIGFKDVHINGDMFLINNNLVKLHGVNHHDTSPVNGYSLTLDEIEKDILLCKEYNIDTIRTSHYPPDPYLLELADYYGIYIVDENDLETHGVWAMHLPPTYNTISDDKKWEAHYIDRISRLYQRDKIHENTSIIMWSLGNEAGGYYNTDRMYEYLKAHSYLPVHYEGVIHSKRVAYDVGSEMYPSVKNVELVGLHSRRQKELNDRPYFLCEYAHAMGVGPGDVEAYWEQIYKYDNIMGGCVWEMVDHAVKEKDGTYTYGGDHGEWEHDGNFCVDGMFYPDRKPSTGAHIMKYIYRPIRVRHIKDDIFEIFNTKSFTNASNFNLNFKFNDGTSSDYTFDIAPLSKKEVKIPLGKEVDGTLSLIVTCTDLEKKEACSEEQIVIKQVIRDLKGDRPLPSCFTANDGKITIQLNNEECLTSNNQYNLLYRVSTDNDTDYLFRRLLDPFYAQTERFISQESLPFGLRITTEINNKAGRFHVVDEYEGHEEGIVVTSSIHPIKAKGFLPRFGKCFYLSSSYDDVDYVARCGETYNDMRDHFVIKEVKCHVSDMVEPNIRPQESGNRMDCQRVRLSSKNNKVSFVALRQCFELGIKPYSDQELTTMKHRSDEIRSGTYVTIQAFQQGIGTGACGPQVRDIFKYPANKDYSFKFLIKIN